MVVPHPRKHGATMGVLQGLLDLVFAPRCLGCGGGTGSAAALVCGRCRSRLLPPPAPLCPRCGFPRLRTGRAAGETCPECDEWPPGFRAARSACLLQPPADALVHQLKYRGWHRVAAFMAHRMAEVRLPGDVREEAGLVVPVPTTAVRLRERGYNQAAVLADALAEGSGRTVICALSRSASGSSQTTLQPAARLSNVAGAFALVPGTGPDIDGEHLLVVDDVLTTGATTVSCAEALIAGGARCVSVLTFARATGRLRLDGSL